MGGSILKKKLIFATGNKGKMKEIREILGDLDYEILSMKEAGVDVDIVEDGTTFEENAIIKAKTVMEATGSLVLADDSGLEVDYLNKEPGVYSARYMGENTSYRIKNQIILDRLHGVPDIVRSARFVCVIAAAFPDGRVETRRATIEGRIAQERPYFLSSRERKDNGSAFSRRKERNQSSWKGIAPDKGDFINR